VSTKWLRQFVTGSCSWSVGEWWCDSDSHLFICVAGESLLVDGRDTATATPSSDDDPVGWPCPKCTRHNDPSATECKECCTELPEDSHVVTKRRRVGAWACVSRKLVWTQPLMLAHSILLDETPSGEGEGEGEGEGAGEAVVDIDMMDVGDEKEEPAVTLFAEPISHERFLYVVWSVSD
jgi:hypothetical protein